MGKKYLALLSLFMLLPTYANAWYLNAKTSTTGQGTISPAGNKTYAAGVNSDEYTVTPNAEAGYKVARITLDGVTLKGNAFGKYVVPYSRSKSYRYLVAYFTKNTVDITVTAGAGGAVREDTFESLTKIPVGSNRTFLVIPNPGYRIGTVTAAGATITENATTGYKVLSFTNLQANQIVSVTFVKIPVISCPEIRVPLPFSIGDPNPVCLNPSCVSNLGEFTYTWTLTGATSSGGTVIPLATAQRNVVFMPPKVPGGICLKANTPGTYTLRVTATSGGQSISDNVVVKFEDGKAADLNQCTACHNGSTPQVIAAYTTGAHGAASGHNTGTCQRCHATQGALIGAEKGWTGSYDSLMASQASAWTPNAPWASNFGVSCVVCHNTHEMRSAKTVVDGAVAAWNPNGGVANDQYDVCTSCHTLTDNAGAVVGNYHNGGSINFERTITDTHFDNPATPGATYKDANGVEFKGLVEGYVVRANSANPCADCHNLHTANIEVQEQWAESAHAGKIAAKKEAKLCAEAVTFFAAAGVTDCEVVPADVVFLSSATSTSPAATPVDAFHEGYNAYNATTKALLVAGSVKLADGSTDYLARKAALAAVSTAAATDDADGNAWIHYPWADASRSACQRCHTATGVSNFLNAPATYDAAKNDFSHLKPGQQELLYCWGCHNDAQTGALRNPGALTVKFSNNATASFADAGKSNVCIACHSGRENQDSIVNSTADFTYTGFLNSHYLVAAGTLYNKGGYEFAGQNYDNLGYHKNVGNPADGPCVTCHMSAEGHTFEAVPTSEACAACHGGLNAAIVDASKEKFHEALEELRLALKAKGIHFWPVHPYFYKVEVTAANAATTAIQGNAFKAWGSKDVMGAAFNYNLIEHEPGAFAHNRFYALKLIQDSIDFLADGAINGVGTSPIVDMVIRDPEFGHSTRMNCSFCHVPDPEPHLGGEVGHVASYIAPATNVGVGACTDCHADGNTAANISILVQYAESGHGDIYGDPWVHYDWRSTSRATCGRCHTASGYADIQSGGNGMPFDGVADAGKVAEVLRCDGCHSNVADGTLYNPGAVTVKSTSGAAVLGATGEGITLPDSGKSNGCNYCHTGAGNMFSTWSASRIASHHAVAAGTLYGTTTRIGYEFKAADGSYLDYAIPADITAHAQVHAQIGAGSEGVQGAGPCVSCHMESKNHTFEAVNEETQTITAQALCNTCHTVGSAYEMTFAKLEEEKEGYFAAGQVLIDMIAAANGKTNYTTAAITGAATNANDRAAWYNSKLFPNEEKGAFAHNRFYTKRLIFDSIDWLQDGALNGTIDTIGFDAGAATWLGTTRP